MSNYIFLKDNNEQGPTTYYAISKEKIEKLNVCDTYTDYGQLVGHYDAGDYSIENSASDAYRSCEKAIKEKFGVEATFTEEGIVKEIDGEEVPSSYDDEHDVDYDVEKANKLFNLAIEIQDFIEEWRKENEVFNTCEGFDYWDGHNWQTITVSSELDGEPSHSIVDDENLVAELNKAIEEREFQSEGFGEKIYEGNGYKVIDSAFEGHWESYMVIPVDQYETAKM